MKHCLGVIVAAVVLLTHIPLGAAQTLCTPPKGRPSCVCKTENGTIDLTSISHRDKPYFSGITGPEGDEYTYYYNPCYAFKMGTSGCNEEPGVAACQQDENHDSTSWFNLGITPAETIYINDNGTVYIQYDGGQDSRLSIVKLECDMSLTTPTLVADGDYETQLTYIFHLKSKCACPNGCGSASSGGNISGYIGIILILLAIGGVAAYFIVGAIILKIKFEKTGTDIIPQKSFWTELPFVIKDGFVFTFSPLIHFINSKRKGYNSV